jgi:hypothetical protein
MRYYFLHCISGDSSFEHITTSNDYIYYPSGSIIGDWTTSGTGVYIVYTGVLNVDPNPNGLLYSCMLQTSASSTTVYIEKTFTNVVVGNSYSVSFWNVLRPFFFTEMNPPMSFSVILGGITVYSTIPSTLTWLELSTSATIASSTSITLRFQISSTDNLNRYIAIDAVTLVNHGSCKLEY